MRSILIQVFLLITTASWPQLLILAAGVVQLILAGANFFLPGILDYRSNLAVMKPILRHIFVTHSIYLVLVLLLFSGLCFLFTRELAGGSALGRFLSGFMALFWLIRIPLQLFYFDFALRRERRPADVAYTLAVSYLALAFSTVAVWAGAG
jgi:hypothetical protein